jgi:hypothetical protein
MSGKLTKAQQDMLERLAGTKFDGVSPRNLRSLCDKLSALGLARWKGPGPHEYIITDAGRAALRESP